MLPPSNEPSDSKSETSDTLGQPAALSCPNDTSLFLVPTEAPKNSRENTNLDDAVANFYKNLPTIKKRIEQKGKDGEPVILEISQVPPIGLYILSAGGKVQSYGIEMNGEPMQIHHVGHLNIGVSDFLDTLGNAIRDAAANSTKGGYLSEGKDFRDILKDIKRVMESTYPSKETCDTASDTPTARKPT